MSQPAKKFNIADDGSWRYTNAHDLYSVETGEVWVSGNHTFTCGDLLGVTPFWDAAGSMVIDLIYVDPPWAAGIAKSYRTKAGLTGSVDFPSLLKACVRLAAERGLPAYVETSNRSIDVVDNAIFDMGGAVTAHWPITYYRKNPGVLVGATFDAIPDQLPDFTDMDDDHTPSKAIGWHKAALVADPCGGRGLTARSAEAAGIASLTNELSPFRMAEAMKSVAALNGIEPERVK